MLAMFEDLHGDLRRFAYSIARHEHEANDLLQDAFEKALVHSELEQWPRHKQKAWFYRVMKNELIDQRRKLQREMEWEEANEPAFQFAGLTAIETADLLRSLSPIQSDIVFKRYWIGLSSNEISEQTALTASTVRYHLAQAIKTLRKQLEEDE